MSSGSAPQRSATRFCGSRNSSATASKPEWPPRRRSVSFSMKLPAHLLK